VKKSQTITLTIVAAVAMATARAQAPVSPPDPNGCDEILKSAAIGNSAIPSRCVARVHNGFAEARVGGFGAIARVRNSGGS
jgi:hypothetical protein